MLLGPTGAGKTTTLRLVAGLERPDAGRDPYRRPRRDARSSRRRATSTFVFQQYSLYPHLSVSTTISPSRCARRHEAAQRRGQAARRGGRRSWCASTTSWRTARPGFGRRDAACRHRPRAGAQAVDLPDGRTALLARCQAAGRPAPRAEAHPARARRDDALRHPRPDRGHDDGRSHRHPRQGRAGADRHAARQSTPSRPICMSRPASASRRSTFCRSACCPTRRCLLARRRSAHGPST